MSLVFGELVNAEIQKREPPHAMPQIVIVLTARGKHGNGGRLELDLTAGAVEILQWVAQTIDENDYLEKQAKWQEEHDE